MFLASTKFQSSNKQSSTARWIIRRTLKWKFACSRREHSSITLLCYKDYEFRRNRGQTIVCSFDTRYTFHWQRNAAGTCSTNDKFSDKFHFIFTALHCQFAPLVWLITLFTFDSSGVIRTGTIVFEFHSNIFYFILCELYRVDICVLSSIINFYSIVLFNPVCCAICCNLCVVLCFITNEIMLIILIINLHELVKRMTNFFINFTLFL